MNISFNETWDKKFWILFLKTNIYIEGIKMRELRERKN
jgi:hypothetical protein